MSKMDPAVQEHVEELNLRIEALEDQRNKALTEAVVHRAKCALEHQKNQKLKDQVVGLQLKLAALTTKEG